MLRRILRASNWAPRFDSFVQTKPVLFVLSLFDWPRRQIRRLYGWVVSWAETRHATKALAGVSFAESSFFPIPPDPLLIAVTTARPHKYLQFAAICTAASILGGIAGYLIGLGLFESVGAPIIDTYHLHEKFQALGLRYEANAFLAVLTAALTPLPYKLITISAGVFKVNFLAFLAASIIGRSARFFLVATLMHHFGKRYKDKIEKYIDLLSLAFIALIILGVMAVKYI
jgi:membrane protein YqaA with SNARE-associated domain